MGHQTYTPPPLNGPAPQWTRLSISWIDRADDTTADVTVTLACGVVLRIPLGQASDWQPTGDLTLRGVASADTLAGLDIAAVVADVRANVAEAAATLRSRKVDDAERAMRDMLKPWRVSGKARTDEDYARLAVAYWLAVQEGQRPGPTIARLTGMADRYVGGAVAQARKRGLLTKVQPGQTGGRPTDRAWELVGLPDFD